MHPAIKNARAVRTLPSGMLVSRYAVAGGDPWIVYETLEPATWGKTFSSHGSVEHFGGKLYGKITTRRATPPALEALPAGSMARVLAFRSWFASLYEESYAAILAAFPELEKTTSVTRDMGSCSVSGDAALALLPPVLEVGQELVAKWSGEEHRAKVAALEGAEIVLEFEGDAEPYGFELGSDGFYYENNDSQTPVALCVRS